VSNSLVHVSPISRFWGLQTEVIGESHKLSPIQKFHEQVGDI